MSFSTSSRQKRTSPMSHRPITQICFIMFSRLIPVWNGFCSVGSSCTDAGCWGFSGSMVVAIITSNQWPTSNLVLLRNRKKLKELSQQTRNILITDKQNGIRGNCAEHRKPQTTIESSNPKTSTCHNPHKSNFTTEYIYLARSFQRHWLFFICSA